MAERKSELVQDAEALGIEGADEMNKAELEERISARAPDALGPVIPEGQTTPQPPKSSGSPTVGIQPQTAADIPEAGR